MPDPRNNMKRYKSQALSKLESCMEEIQKTLIILDYEPEYIETYMSVVMTLRQLREQDDSLSLVQYWEMMKDKEDMPDLGTRYRYLIEQLDLYIDLFQLQIKWIGTIV